jgi:hypothetical protein
MNVRSGKKPGLVRRGRHIGGAAIGALGFCTPWAVDKHHGVRGDHPEWIEVVEVDMHLENLPEKFRGKRIVHISDLHCSRTVSNRYLRHCVDRVNHLKADIVILTGDYITHDLNGKFRNKAVELVGAINNNNGVYACLGNHDYGFNGMLRSKHHGLMHDMIEGMEQGGVNILRNDSAVVEIDGEELWLVGLGDIWAGDFKPKKAFKKVPDNEAVITLLHNPDGVKHLHDFPVDAVMSGHTHGAVTEHVNKFGWGVQKRKYHAGMYHVRGKKMYVNRGLGRLGRARLGARPEITVCTLC